jgi:hypothetical protein
MVTEDVRQPDIGDGPTNESNKKNQRTKSNDSRDSLKAGHVESSKEGWEALAGRGSMVLKACWLFQIDR